MACKGKDDAAKANATVADLSQKCEQLAKACGDNDKHIGKLVEECTAAANQQGAKGCPEKMIALYGCYERELCGKADKVWVLDDLRVLADRKRKCVTEQGTARECTGQ
jgi:hypothetical protein